MRIVWRGRILIFYFKEFGECQSVCSRRILRSECQTRTLSPYCCWRDAEHCSCLTVGFWFGVMMLGIAAQNIPRAVHHHVQWIQVADVSWGPGYGIYGIYGNSVLTYLDVQMGKKWAKRTKLNTQEAMRPYIFLELCRLWVLLVCMFWMGLHSLANQMTKLL